MSLRRVCKQTRLYVLAILIVCCACTSAWALDPQKAFDQYVANRWSIQDGLPQISVLAIAQDRDGYIWVGTQDGLARFDGVRFTSFTPSIEPQLQGIWIRSLMLGHDGKLWIATYKGLTVYADGRFTAIQPADASAHRSLDIYALAEDERGQIIAGTSDGLMKVAAGKLVTLDATIKPAYSLLRRADGLWIGTKGAVLHMQDRQMVRTSLPSNASSAAVMRLAEAQGRLWAGTSQGLFSYDGNGWTSFDDPILSSSPIGALFEDHDHNLWVGANPSLARLRDGKLVEAYAGRAPLTYKNVMSVFEDREGNLWLGSQVEGLTRLWNGWTRRYSVGDGLSDPVVWSLARGADNTVWVGTSDGVSQLAFGRFSLIAPGSALPHPHAYNLFVDGDKLWIGTRRGLVVRDKDGQITAPPEFAPISSAQINGIVRGPDGAMWFPTTEGLFRLEHEDQPDAQLRAISESNGTTHIRARLIVWLRNHRVLVGTETGLFDLRGDQLIPTGASAGLPQDLDVTAIHELPSGDIVVGTQAEQLFVFHGKRWIQLGIGQGMPANATFFMAEDDRGYLWLAGIRGILRVPLIDIAQYEDGKIQQVRGEMVLNERGDRNAGQQGFCCNGAGMSKGYIDGHVLWLPSRDGVVAIDTHGIVRNPLPPTVVIERVDYPGGSYQPSTMPSTLEAQTRDLAFEFTAPSFQDPHSVQIRYRLVGYDHDWHELDDSGRRRANYTNLPPREYTFEVMAANNAGVWNPIPARLSFSIRPYFHETRLFQGLIALMLGLIVYAGYRRQRHAHEIQRVSLEREVFERTQQLHISNERLENASQTDPLTGLRNRRYLANQIPADLAFYDREQQRNGLSEQMMLFALVRIDRMDASGADRSASIDDRVLQQFAQVLGSLLRTGDYIARWEGAEFLLLFRPMHSKYVADIGERIRHAIRSHAFDGGTGAPMQMSCSIGLAEYPLFRDAQRRPGWEQLVDLARAAMNWVAQHGQDGWAAFRPTLRTDLSGILRELQADPQPLIDNGRLQLIGSHISRTDDANTPQG